MSSRNWTRRGVLEAATLAAATWICLQSGFAQSANPDPLPSWNRGEAKSAIIDFVKRVTDVNGRDYVEMPDRIAVFDNDGTLWTEHPVYTQLAFALDRIKALAPSRPEWRTQQPFQAVLEGDSKALAAEGEQGLAKIIAATHAGMTTTEFQRIVSDWIATARHPRFEQPYTALVYQPMVELLAYLRANGFKTFIVSGGGVDFMRPWTERAYGIPPEQVIGSMGKLKYEMRPAGPVLLKEADIDLIDDGPGKPAGIQKFIGRVPIFAAGNSDGDLQMLQWTTSGSGARFGMLVRHTDVDREYAYDRNTEFGRLDTALEEALKRGWLVLDMKKDWSTIYPFQDR